MLSGLYVTPGLVDVHAHVYVGGRPSALFPDDTALIAGATTVVDAGISGWRTFDDFKRTIIDKSKTRVLAFLNIVGHGMGGTKVENNVEDMDPEATATKVKQFPDLIVGIKTAHFGLPGWDALKRAVEAGRLSEKPVLVDSSILSNTGRNTRDKVLDIMRPGDIHSHAYNDRQLELLNRFSGKVQPYMLEARKRGVLFDLGHGGGSFVWTVAARAMREGFPPDIISTDSHPSSYMLPQVTMPNCISKIDGARNGTAGRHSPFDRGSRAGHPSLSRNLGPLAKADRRHSRLPIAARRLRSERFLENEAAGEQESRMRSHDSQRRAGLRPEWVGFPVVVRRGELRSNPLAGGGVDGELTSYAAIGVWYNPRQWPVRRQKSLLTTDRRQA